jgi:hypothetical protein
MACVARSAIPAGVKRRGAKGEPDLAEIERLARRM